MELSVRPSSEQITSACLTRGLLAVMRGGKRQNSGRKKGEETTTINFRVPIDKKEKLKTIADLSQKFKNWTDKLIENENT